MSGLGITDLGNAIRTFEMRVARLEGEKDNLLALQAEARQRIEVATSEAELLDQALRVLQALEEAWRSRFQTALSSVVSQGLTAVFGEPMTVNLENRLFRDVAATEITLTTGKDAKEITAQIMDASGGSVVNVVSFLFRVLFTVSARPQLRPLLILDEAFSFADEYTLPSGIGQLLQELFKRVGSQILMSTHNQEITSYGDVVYEVKKEGTVGSVRRMRAADTERV